MPIAVRGITARARRQQAGGKTTNIKFRLQSNVLIENEMLTKV